MTKININCFSYYKNSYGFQRKPVANCNQIVIADRIVGRPMYITDVPGGGCLLIQAPIINMNIISCDILGPGSCLHTNIKT